MPPRVGDHAHRLQTEATPLHRVSTRLAAIARFELVQYTREIHQLGAMSLGFGAGSVLFAVGAIMTVAESNVIAIGVAFVVGALLFTTAAAVQWRAAADRPMPSRLRDPDWMSAAIQFAGTLSFNVMTIRALWQSIDSSTIDYSRIWHPDVIGSLLFLISSWVAWHPLARQHRHHLLRGRSRLICWANMLGSVFFGLSAVGAQMLPDGTLKNVRWDNLGTLLGAVGFFVAAVALRPTAKERLSFTATS